MSGQRIGWIGTGVLGSAMVRRLRACSFSVAAFNRTPARALALGDCGVVHAATAAAASEGCDVVFLCLNGGQVAAESVLFAEGGVVHAARPPAIVADASTRAPEEAVRLAQRLAEQGISYVDAPVSGGPEGALAGRLATLLSGPEPAAHVVGTIAHAFSRHVQYVGASGLAQTLKVANNLAEAINLWGAAEAIGLALRGGVPLPVLAEALGSMRGASVYMEVLLQRLMQPSDAVSASLAVRLKDLHLARDAARQAGLAFQLGAATLEAFTATAEALGDQSDQTSCFTYVTKPTQPGWTRS